MGKVVVFNHLTLDGVMQSPSGPDEDPSGGFRHGGWAAQRMGPELSGAAGDLAGEVGYLFGRRTYEQFAGFWSTQGDDVPFAGVLNRGRKYVASRTLTEPLAWSNATLLQGDAAEAVARLKQEAAGDLLVFGSGDLIRSLMPRNLVDRFVLLVHPLVLGTGRRLFAEGSAPSTLRLVDASAAPSGVAILMYEPAGTAG